MLIPHGKKTHRARATSPSSHKSSFLITVLCVSLVWVYPSSYSIDTLLELTQKFNKQNVDFGEAREIESWDGSAFFESKYLFFFNPSNKNIIQI